MADPQHPPPAPPPARPRRTPARPPLPPFERVIEQHGRDVLRLCVARAGDAGEDCFQEAMVLALRAYDSVRDPAAIRGWLLSIAARATIDHHRARSRAPVPTADAEPLAKGRAAPDEPSHGTGDDDPLWQRVRALAPKQREAITLRFLADLTYAEIALVMQTSEEAARRSVFDGLERLRAHPDYARAAAP